MNYILTFIFLSVFVLEISSQRVIKAKNKVLEKTEKALPRYHIVDYNLADINSESIEVLFEHGLFLNSDSSLMNAVVYIYLTKTDDLNTVFGWLCGRIINGRKEGAWFKEIYTHKNKHVIVQKLNYSNGILDGGYFEYNLEGEILRTIYNGSKPEDLIFTINNQMVSEEQYWEYKKDEPTEMFTNGTGLFLDYYYDIGVLKERGEFKDGRKQGQWYTYDKSGHILRIDTYHDGVCITD